MKRLVVISNRLPLNIHKKREKLYFRPSVGGLATGVGSLMNKELDGIWIGWPGIAEEKISKKDRAEINKQLDLQKYYPVYLNQTEINNFYLGFSNRTLWPLFHYFTQYTVYRDSMWNSYVQVNKKFCEQSLRILKDGDIVWVHDYHLLLLPQMLRQERPDISIGFFLHIPFPSFEIFRLLPWRKDILTGLLGSDLIGFHTYDYVRHFRSSLRNVLGLEHVLGTYSVNERKVKVDTFPMGIDFEQYAQAADMPKVQKEMTKYRKNLGDRKVVFSVDRLDYTKGILERLYAFDYFLDNNPKYKNKVTLILVAVPSRSKVINYKQLKKDLDGLVGYINGKHGTIGWMPVNYLYCSLPFHSLTALYNLSDVALITPVRDGMNLIAKEYVATQKDGKGVLILSEMAGSAKELSEALIVNPNNLKEISGSLYEALTMSEQKQVERISLMKNRLQRYDIKKWADDFIKNLIWIKDQNRTLLSRKITEPIMNKILSDYQRSKHRLIFLDYDGTLTPFAPEPHLAKPDKKVLTLLHMLSQDKHNDVIIISGRDRAYLDECFNNFNLSLVAEHGAWIKEKNSEWRLIDSITNYWKDELRPVLEHYMDRTPGSLIEEKDFSLAWHFRKSDLKLASIRARELKDALFSLTSNFGIDVLEGDKVVEIRNTIINKGTAALKWINKKKYEFILSAGDDRTDEDTFQALPEHSYTIKVGLKPSCARFNIESITEMRSLLAKMAGGIE